MERRDFAPALEAYAVGAALTRALGRRRALEEALGINEELLEWASTGSLESVVQYEIDDEVVTVRIGSGPNGSYDVHLGGRAFAVEVASLGSETARLNVDDRGTDAIYCDEEGDALHLILGPRSYAFVDLSAARGAREAETAGGRVVAPMHGRLLQILVREGQTVARGDRLAILEAMKRQHEIFSEVDGTVSRITSQADAQVGAGDLLLEIEPAGD